MNTTKYPHTNKEYHWLYSVANSEGLVDPLFNQYITYEQAYAAALTDDGAIGNCWPVLIVPVRIPS